MKICVGINLLILKFNALFTAWKILRVDGKISLSAKKTLNFGIPTRNISIPNNLKVVCPWIEIERVTMTILRNNCPFYVRSYGFLNFLPQTPVSAR